MFRKRRHIRAKSDEWIHVHRGHQQPMKRSMEPGEIIGWGIGILVIAMLTWELIKWLFALFLAALPFLAAIAVLSLIGLAVLKHKLKF